MAVFPLSAANIRVLGHISEVDLPGRLLCCPKLFGVCPFAIWVVNQLRVVITRFQGHFSPSPRWHRKRLVGCAQFDFGNNQSGIRARKFIKVPRMPGRVRDAFEAWNGGDAVPLWFMLGDNAYPFGTDWEYTAALFQFYPQRLRQSALWPVPGNHDCIASDCAERSGPYYAAFSLPTRGEAGGVPSHSPAYYSFELRAASRRRSGLPRDRSQQRRRDVSLAGGRPGCPP